MIIDETDRQQEFDGTGPDVRGTCGIGIHEPQFQVNMGSLVRSAACFGADFVFTTKAYSPQTTAVGHETSIPVFDNAHLETVVPHNAELVAIEYTDDSTPLSAFQHPEHAVYVAGSEGPGLPDDVVERADHVVHLPTAWCENVATAAAITLHDRVASAAETRSAFPIAPGLVDEQEVES